MSKNIANTPPKSGSSKLINKLVAMGYTNQSEAYHAIAKYLVTGKMPQRCSNTTNAKQYLTSSPVSV